MAVCEEISSGGILGILGLDQVTWGGKGGYFFECWTLNPCCGVPNPLSMLTCCVCWTCCICCSHTKLYATSLGQDCAIVPHCLCVWCCPCVSSIFTRYNLRKGVGAKGNIIGDCVCLYCCGCCSICQELRTVPTKGWNLIEQGDLPKVIVPEIIFIAGTKSVNSLL